MDLPPVNGVPPTEYEIMEIIVKKSEAVFPVTVVIYDDKGKPVFSVSVLLGDASWLLSNTWSVLGSLC